MRRALTLLELLCVLGILAVVMAIALPALVLARESANRTACAANLRQVGTGALSYTMTWGRLPDGGGPVGMWYQILSHLERQDLRLAGDRSPSPVALYFCPSRRGVTTWTDPVRRTVYALGDYAWPTDPLDSVHGWWTGRWTTAISATDYPSWIPPGTPRIPCPRRTMLEDIRDGTSRTMLASEKSLPRHLYRGGSPGDNGDVYGHLDYDNARECNSLPSRDSADPGASGSGTGFGSAHPSGLNVLTCDGSVRHVSYLVRPAVWHALATRAGGEVVDVP